MTLRVTRGARRGDTWTRARVSDATEREVPDENPGRTSVCSTIRQTDGSTRVASPPSPLTPRFQPPEASLSQRERGPRFSPRSLFPFEHSISSPLLFVQSFKLGRERRARAHTVLPHSILSFLASFVHLRRRRGGVPARCKRNSSLLHAGVGPFPTLRRGISTPFRRTSNARSYAVGRAGARRWRKQFPGLLKRPSARRGPGIVSVDRNVRSKCRCSCVLQFTS